MAEEQAQPVANTPSVPEGEAPSAIPESIATPESIPEPEALQTQVAQGQPNWLPLVQALAPALASLGGRESPLEKLAMEMLVQDLIQLRRHRSRLYSFSGSEEELGRSLSE